MKTYVIFLNTSLIDGIYGKGTAGALIAYNEQYLTGTILKTPENAEELVNTVLGLSSKPETKTAPIKKGGN